MWNPEPAPAWVHWPHQPQHQPKQPLATRPPIHHRPYTPLQLLRSAAPGPREGASRPGERLQRSTFHSPPPPISAIASSTLA
jgi:hypothetical protein